MSQPASGRSSPAPKSDNATESIEPESAPPPLPALHAAAQAGDLQTVNELLDAETDPVRRTALVNTRDNAGITALHWSSINARLLVCKALLNAGAEVDAIGGDLLATPMQWAARSVPVM